MYEYLEDVNAIRTCYDYFKNIPDMDKFNKIPIPKTEYQSNLKEMYKSPLEMWLEDFTRRHYNDNVVELLGKQTFEDFEYWRKANNIIFDTNSVKLGVALSNLRIDGGVTKGRHTTKGDTKHFHISKLKEYFNIGILINYEDNVALLPTSDEVEESKDNIVLLPTSDEVEESKDEGTDEDDEEDLVNEPVFAYDNKHRAKTQGLLERLDFLRLNKLNNDEQAKIEKRLYYLMSLSQDEDDEEDLVIEPAATKVNATNNNEAKIQGLLARLEFLRLDNLNKDEQYKIEKRLFELIRQV